MTCPLDIDDEHHYISRDELWIVADLLKFFGKYIDIKIIDEMTAMRVLSLFYWMLTK